MSSPQPNASSQKSPKPATDFVPDLSFTDIMNYETFMDSLIGFMNETALTMLQVKQRSGLSPACVAPVRMNKEEKEKKMNDIVANLSVKYKEEASILHSNSDCDCEAANNENSVRFEPMTASSFIQNPTNQRSGGGREPFNLSQLEAVDCEAQLQRRNNRRPPGERSLNPTNQRSLGRSLQETTSGGGRKPFNLSQVESFNGEVGVQMRVPPRRPPRRPRELPSQARTMSRGVSYPVSPRALPASSSMAYAAPPQAPPMSRGNAAPVSRARSYPKPESSGLSDDWEEEANSGACNERCTNDCSFNRTSRQQYR